MADAARVSSLDALARFRATLADFGDNATLALNNAEHDIQRTMAWLQHDRRAWWKQQLRAREKKLDEARAQLNAAKLQAQGGGGSVVLEKKAVAKMERLVEEARWKLERIAYWSRTLEREALLYKGQAQGLSGRLERDVPKALARLSNLMDHLDKYVRLAPPGETPQSVRNAAPGREEDETGEEGDAQP